MCWWSREDLKESLVSVLFSVQVQEISYPDSHLQLFRKNKYFKIIDLIQSFVGTNFFGGKNNNSSTSLST